MRAFGPLDLSQYSEPLAPCAACNKPFANGAYTTLIPLGPGDDREAQEKARRGMPFNAVCAHVHWACAGQRFFPNGKPITP